MGSDDLGPPSGDLDPPVLSEEVSPSHCVQYRPASSVPHKPPGPLRSAAEEPPYPQTVIVTPWEGTPGAARLPPFTPRHWGRSPGPAPNQIGGISYIPYRQCFFVLFFVMGRNYGTKTQFYFLKWNGFS